MSKSVCIWLNGEPTAIGKRAENLWNSAKYRVATDGAINAILKRKESVEWPHVICGDFDSMETGIDPKNAKYVVELFSRPSSIIFRLLHLPDQNHTDLTKTIQWCLEQLSENQARKF
ncbi:hypothetical protein B9Z55_027465 [Caenorhabditis nigoni]|nr:hypothetical protein B9Z55_027465 [Caenorhabditis nigoni]